MPLIRGALRLLERAAPGTPSSGEVAFWSVDGSALLMKDDGGQTRIVGPNAEAAVFSASV